jgi:hypothetical protein
MKGRRAGVQLRELLPEFDQASNELLDDRRSPERSGYVTDGDHVKLPLFQFGDEFKEFRAVGEIPFGTCDGSEDLVDPPWTVAMLVFLQKRTTRRLVRAQLVPSPRLVTSPTIYVRVLAIIMHVFLKPCDKDIRTICE